MQQVVLVLGYFNRNNIGDDVFSYVFETNLIDIGCKYYLMNTDDIGSLAELPTMPTVIICGGGDIVNNYFMPKIMSLVGSYNIPLYAVGVGIPYPQLINDGILDRFNYIIHRNSADIDKLEDRYTDRSMCLPDLAFNLLTMTNENSASTYLMPHTHNKKIGVFLARPIYNNPVVYNKILANLATFIVGLAKKRTTFINQICGMHFDNYVYHFYLIPSCTNNNTSEDDRIINNDLFDTIKTYGDFPNIHLLTTAMPIPEIRAIFKSFYMTICTRFHAHVFSIMTDTPVLSIYCSRKVQNLMTENNLIDYCYQMPVDPVLLYPTDLDTNAVIDKFNKIINYYSDYKHALTQIVKNIINKLPTVKIALNNLIMDPIIPSNYNTVLNQTAIYVSNFLGQNNVAELVAGTTSILDIVKNNNIDIRAQTLAEVISYSLTLDKRSAFYYGLNQQVLTPSYNLQESIKWISRRVSVAYNLMNPTALKIRKFNMRYFNQHTLEGFHRSGWAYVVKGLMNLHNPDGIIFDSFLDKTFGWECDFYTKMGLLPLQLPWVGVFHHTPDTEYSSNNLTTVFDKEVFINSLSVCHGIITLSLYLKEWIENKLAEIRKRLGGALPYIRVINLTHPTEIMTSNLFSIEKFYRNTDRKLLQIGAWLRDTYAIYRLPKLNNYAKCVLKGKDMDHYYVTNDKEEQIKSVLLGLGSTDDQSGLCCRYHHHHHHVCRPYLYCNKYISGMVDMIDDNYKQVTILDNVNNQQYDELLTCNIVFIRLINASAVNTLIECIVRHTPILINRLPAIEEYIGKEYPLFYNSFEDAYAKLHDYALIYAAHYYLRELDKTKFQLTTFMKQLIRSIF